ncbi:MAG: hypothetical protein ACR2O6_13030, partial [Ilumatobacteraceae bacterium]
PAQPQYGQQPPPQPQYGQQPPAQQPPGHPGYAPPPGYEEKPPRPDAKVGAGLIIAGAVIMIIGVFLPWFDAGGESANGTDNFITSDLTLIEGPGYLMIGIAVIVGGLGLALFFAGRVLAVAIIAIVMAAIAEFMGLAMVGLMSDLIIDGDLGIGVILQAIAPLASLAGAIVVTAKRRR